VADAFARLFFRGSLMKLYLMSLGAGLLVGVIYSLINVRSPAPPAVALIGLLGILLGEQIIPVGKQLITGTSLSSAWNQSQCTQHLFGKLPGRQPEQMKVASTDTTRRS
jgi:XapX domain-containing protein